MFENCLKKSGGLTADTIGYTYFNIVENKCFDEINGTTVFVSSKPY